MRSRHGYGRGMWRNDGEGQLTRLQQWERETLAALKITYPAVPKAVTYPPYAGVLQPLWLQTALGSDPHLQDLTAFVASVGAAPSYRIDHRLTQLESCPYAAPLPASFPALIARTPEREAPEKVHWVQRLLGSKEAAEAQSLADDVESYNKWRVRQWASYEAEWHSRSGAFTYAVERNLSLWRDARTRWADQHLKESAILRAARDGYLRGGVSEVTHFFDLHLRAVPVPPWAGRNLTLLFDDLARTLLVRLRLPHLTPFIVMKTRELRSGPKHVPATKSEQSQFKAAFMYLLPLRFAWEVAHLDQDSRLDAVAVNGYVRFDDPATGREREDTILSFLATSQNLKSVDLHRIEPKACFRALKGVAAAEILDLVPVRPVLDFDLNDKRFVEGRAVLGGVGTSNLATMDWQDFEHLIREIFAKEFGTDVRVTQASRDKGVDAVAFDPDPIRGGKFVIQAKRYIHTVDVSAVRDLYGTMMNEGANRGILVTTSNYGRDAYEFAQGKPISLLNGSNLLSLLEKHGYQCRIDLTEYSESSKRPS